jgi:hypothetical protein
VSRCSVSLEVALDNRTVRIYFQHLNESQGGKLALKSRVAREFGALGILLCVDTLLAIVVAHVLPFYAPNEEHLYAAQEFAAHHFISSVFVPIGYSGLLGISDLLGGQAGMTVLTVMLSLLVIVAAWFYLRGLGLSQKSTLVLTGLLSVYPDFLLSLHKAQDTAITAALLFAFLTFLMKSLREGEFGWVDGGLALTLGYSLLVRPNLLPLLVLTWFLFWQFRVPKAFRRVVIQLLIVVACYLAGTTAIHRSPFLPQNGPYNFCAGFNEYTQDYSNEEDSLLRVLAAHGVRLPEQADPFSYEAKRSLSLAPAYRHLAVQFIREHPGTAVWLIGVKFWNMMRPDFQVHSAKSLGGMLKILSALAVPLWVLGMFVLPHPGPPRVKYVLVLTVALYILPFLVTVSSPRFRVPLDFLCWVDLGGMVWAWRMRPAGADKKLGGAGNGLAA